MSGLDLERCHGKLFLPGQWPSDVSSWRSTMRETRKQFGRPIGEFQMVQGMIADMYTSIEALRSLDLSGRGGGQ